MRLEKALKGGGKFIAFITAGDPSVEDSYEIACDIIGSGADVLELGLPFSDPIADGPTIQAAGQRALEAGMNTDEYFKLASRISKEYGTPLVCLTYYNLILQYGLRRFAVKCYHSGVEGVIVPDLPVEEAGSFTRELRNQGVDFIFLVSETTPDERLDKILSRASGFVYVVALLGTTGAREKVSKNLKKLIKRVKKHTSLPVAVGFGISAPDHAREVISYGADAAIVGSAIVKLVANGDREKIKSLVKQMKAACG